MGKKNFPVLLRQDVETLGKSGELVEVRKGYAFNYLFPQKIAVRVTPGILKEVAMRRAREEARLLAIKQEAERNKVALETIGRFVIRKKVGEGDMLFGTVTHENIAELILATSGISVDRRDITVEEIRKTGVYPVSIRLHAEVTVAIRIQVTPE
ncbi:MAG: 50S ribosomal protein L9 [Synechococcales cyanobacterium]